MKTKLHNNSYYEFYPNFAKNKEKIIFDNIYKEIEWEHRKIKIYGKEIFQPRLIGWGGTVPYTYSRSTLDPKELKPQTANLLRVINKITNNEFNHVLLNLYRDGKDSISAHSDDEKKLGNQPIIASLSFGASRKFKIEGLEESYELVLNSGSLLIMGGNMQRYYKHSIPKEPKVKSPRINLTFRKIF